MEHNESNKDAETFLLVEEESPDQGSSEVHSKKN